MWKGDGVYAGDMYLLCFWGPSLILTFNPQISVDSLSWEFIVSTVDDSNLVYPPKVGARCAWGSEQRRVWLGRVLGAKVGNNWLRKKKRGGSSGALATVGLDILLTYPHVSPGWCLDSGPVPGGCGLGPEELLLDGGRTHAACLPHAHDPLPTGRKP